MEGDVATVRRAMCEALDLFEVHRLQEVYTVPAVAAIEVLEFHGRTEGAATILAALDGQPFGLPETYARYRRAGERLPSRPVPDHRLPVSELHEIVVAQLDDVTAPTLPLG
jgi:hypothetical protein